MHESKMVPVAWVTVRTSGECSITKEEAKCRPDSNGFMAKLMRSVRSKKRKKERKRKKRR